MTPEPVWVDLGLPSGLLWAQNNLGAQVPWGYGKYFTWANVEGHIAGDGYQCTLDSYLQTPGRRVQEDIPLAYDAANVILGNPWRIPTEVEFKELVDNCTAVWTTVYGVSGYQFTSNINGKSIFIPAAGYYGSQTVVNVNVAGRYWSASFVDNSFALNFFFGEDTINANHQDYRYIGFPIRPVMPA